MKKSDVLPIKRRDFMKGAAALPVAGAVVGTTSLAPGTVEKAAAQTSSGPAAGSGEAPAPKSAKKPAKPKPQAPDQGSLF